MCSYCSGRMVANIINEDQGDDYSPGITAYVMGGSLHVDVDGDDWFEFETPINYCPMCGRDLRGDSND